MNNKIESTYSRAIVSWRVLYDKAINLINEAPKSNCDISLIKARWERGIVANWQGNMQSLEPDSIL